MHKSAIILFSFEYVIQNLYIILRVQVVYSIYIIYNIMFCR